MKNKITNKFRMLLTHCANRAWVPLMVSLIALGSVGISQASVRLEVSGVPFYARGADTPAEAYTDGQTAVITFYRDPACVPPGFNLMDFYDENAPDCLSCVAGFEIWQNGPGTADLGPMQVSLKNTGPMAIWFVSLAELQAAQGDGMLTIGELSSLGSLLKGTARVYTEILHPYGVAQRTLVIAVASGLLEDGRSFAYQVIGNQTGHDEYPGVRHIKIQFKAQATERETQTSADLPFYARIGQGEIYHDGEWAGIAFYRPPECIRADFNLLDFMDIPAAFGCNAPEPYLIGIGIFKGEVPIQSKLELAPGQTMPVWFVRWSDLSAAVADTVLTIGDLKDLPSLLKGEATFYTETLHPSGAAQQTMISIVASGFLADGRKFTFQATGTKEENRLNHVNIAFK